MESYGGGGGQFYRRVSSTKNLVKFRQILQPEKTLFSVVSYYLKDGGDCSKNLCHARGGNSLTKNRKISRAPLFYFREIHQKFVKIVLFWINSLKNV